MGIGRPSGMMITWIIIIVTCIFSITAFNRRDIFDRWKFNPYIIIQSKQWYRFFTYSLLHADWVHLTMNMFVLYSFGELVEIYMKYYFGIKGLMLYALLYIGGVFLSVVPSFEKHKLHSWYNAVGASGAVSAVVFSSIIIMPSMKMYLLFLPFPISAPIFGILYLIFSAYMARKASDNIGHDAHFWGALFGALFTIALKPALAISFYYQLLHSIF